MKNTWNMILHGFVISMLISAGISSNSNNETSLVGSKLNGYYGKMSILSSAFAPTALLHLEEFDASLDINSSLRKISRQCIEDSRHYVMALWNQSEWALSMYRASGRLSLDESTNFLIVGVGNVHQDPGLFDQCIASSSPSGRIRGQHCSVFLSAQPLLKHNDGGLLLNEPKVTIAERQFHILAPVSITPDSIIGFCLPSSCSAKDLRTAVAHKIGRTTFQTKNKNGTVSVQSIVTSSHDQFCHSETTIRDQHALDATGITFIVVICFIGLLILISTLHEFWTRTLLRQHENIQKELDYQNVPTHIRVLHCFSALRNVKSFVHTAPFSDDIQCLHGIRALSFFLLIVYHTGSEICFRDRIYNNDAVIQFLTSWYVQPGTNLSVLVDTFLLIGGLLVCSSILKDLDRGRFSLIPFYFHRYLRLTPLYAGIIFFLAAFAGRLGSGPNWIPPLYQSEDCRSYWWTHLLYINTNTHFFASYCMPETWYLSTEMKMFIFSPIFVYPLWRWPKRAGPLLVAALLAASFGFATAIYVASELPPTWMPTRLSAMKKASAYYQLYYANPFARCPPYLIGILLGWILQKTKNCKVYFNKPTLVFGWILTIVMLLVVLCGLMPYMDEEITPVIDPFFRVMYGVFHRTVWAIAITWIILVCAKGYGGYLKWIQHISKRSHSKNKLRFHVLLTLKYIKKEVDSIFRNDCGKVNDLLSSKIFVPLSKISFAGYLVHNNVIQYYVSQLRIPFYFTPIQLVVAYCGILVLSLIISAVLTITIEMPFKNLEKFILPIPFLSSRKNQSASPANPISEGKTTKGE